MAPGSEAPGVGPRGRIVRRMASPWPRSETPGSETTPAGRVVAAVAWVGLCVQALWIAARCLRPLHNSDVFWQVRAGEIAVEQGAVPAFDVFSYTIAGARWNNHEWVFEIAAALLHAAGGWTAIRVLVLTCWGGAALGFAAWIGRRAGPAPALLALTVFHVFAGYKLHPVPQTVSMPLMLTALAAFRSPDLLASPSRAGALAAFMLVWGNLTAESLTFLPILFVDQLARRVSGSAAKADRLAVLLVALAFVAPLVNPPWSSVLDYVLRGTAINRVVNSEFTPIWMPAAVVQPLAKGLARGVVLAWTCWAGLTLWRGRRAALPRVASGFLLVGSACLVERNLWLLCVPAAQLALCAWRCAGALRVETACVAISVGLSGLYARDSGWRSPAAWASGVAAAASGEGVDAHFVPTRCIDAISGAPEGTRVFTTRQWASYLVWRVPQARVFYDGRNLEYGVEGWAAGTEVITGGPGAQRILDASRTDVVIAGPGWIALPGLAGSEWTPVLEDPMCVVYRRRSALGG